MDGRKLLLCLSGATESDVAPNDGERVTPPLKDPIQDSYAGGLLDGYAILLDLTAQEPWSATQAPSSEPAQEPYRYDPFAQQVWPMESQPFAIGTETYTTVMASFRRRQHQPVAQLLARSRCAKRQPDLRHKQGERRF